MDESARLRIDKWLWAARFFKTRSLAAQAIELGRVRVDGERIKCSRGAKEFELPQQGPAAEVPGRAC